MNKKTAYKATLLIASCILCLLILSCNIHKSPNISIGTWRGEVDTSGVTFPFHFNLDKKDNDTLEFTLQNGGETIHADYVHCFGDSIKIKFPVYESVIIAAIKGSNGDTLSGLWIKTVYDKVRRVPFKAIFGNSPLFSAATVTKLSVQGKWPTTFADDSKEIGMFKQDGSNVSGTFLDPTGDERYLSGIITGDSLYLIGFDGTSADLFKAEILKGDTLKGMAYYGNGDKLTFTSVKNDSALLPEVRSKIISQNDKLDFTFPDTDGKLISLSDDRYKNKVVIIDIMGSWCHNCLDETAYYVDFYKRYHSKGLEIIGLSFERTHDRKKAISNIKGFIHHFNVPYEILYAGVTQKDSVKKALPQLDEVYGYPTTIILDKAGAIATTETGFSGPATGVYYSHFKTNFENYIDSLLNKK